MRSLATASLFLMAATALATACKDSEPPGTEPATENPADSGSERACPTTTDQIQERLLAPSCGMAGCHHSEDPAADLDLVSPRLESRLNGVMGYECEDRLVHAGAPEYSLLFKKVRFADPGCGARMPMGLPPLDEWTLGCLSQWIQAMPPPPEPEAGPADPEPTGIPVPEGGSCPEGQVLCGTRCIEDVAPTARDVHDRILYPSCGQSLSCHNSSNPKEKLLLVTLEDTLAMIGTPSIQRPERNLIEPGQPELSYVVNKMRGEEMSETSSTGLSSRQMPRLAPPLCDVLIERVEAWIAAGALAE
jgi:hypothetical protein